MITELNQRSQEIFRLIVDAYLETGEPVGSRTLSRLITTGLSPATIRNVMADLEELGLLYAPHTSAGRLPTETGLRLFVDGLMEIGALREDERKQIDRLKKPGAKGIEKIYEEAGNVLSGLSSCAGIVFAPKTDKPLKQIQFVNLGPGRVLVVLVSSDGMVENRLMEVPLDLPSSSLIMASNFLNDRLIGRTISEAGADILAEIKSQRAALDVLTADVVSRGLAVQAQGNDGGVLIVKGHSHLLSDIRAVDELERIRQIMDALENRQTMLKLLQAAGEADGIRVFIGAENQSFSHAGLSMVVAPYKNTEQKIVGAIGVIGPTRLNYGRIVPIVDYTSKIMTHLVGSS